MHCPNCGTMASETARFCSKCGTSLTPATSAETADQQAQAPSPLPTELAVPRRHTFGRRLVGVVLVLILAGVAAAFFPLIFFSTDLGGLHSAIDGAAEIIDATAVAPSETDTSDGQETVPSPDSTYVGPESIEAIDIATSTVDSSDNRGVIFSSPERLLYVIYDIAGDSYKATIATINMDGSDNREIIHDRDGFLLQSMALSGRHSTISPDGHRLAFYREVTDRSGNYELMLMAAEDGTVLLVDDQVWPSFTGFSADSKHFAYTTFHEESGYNIHIVNGEGTEIVTIPSALVVNFFPDNERLLAIKFDNWWAYLAWLNLQDGTVNHLASLSKYFWSGTASVLPAPDGEQVYYVDYRELMVVDVAGGASHRVYEFEDPDNAFFFFSPDHRFLVIYDGYGVGSLDLMALDDHHIVHIDEKVHLETQLSWKEEFVAFSPDGNHLSYISSSEGSESLYVSDVDGRNRHRISEGNAGFSFAFSPDGKQMAFVASTNADSLSDLYVADVDGSNRRRLDEGALSLRYTRDGRYLVYSKVEGLEPGNFQSEIYRIRPNGEDQELLLGSQDGVIALLGWLPSRTDE